MAVTTHNFGDSRFTANASTKHIEMSAPKITAKKEISMVDVLPSLHPQPTGTNLNKHDQDLVNKLSTVPLYQSMDKGYGGMVDNPTM